MNTYDLTVVTPEKTVYEGKVQHLKARNPIGSFGILANHSALLTALEACVLSIDLPDGSKKEFTIGGGCLEFSQNNCTVLADSIE
jgi:F-type H+-transporting ATPase subunit epsilon